VPIVVAAAFALSAGAATIRGPAVVATLTAASDLVLVAHVSSTDSHWGAAGPAGGQIFTTVQLQPTEVWKGEAAPGPVSVILPGGSVGDLAQSVSGVASFGRGEQVVVFLAQRAPGSGTRPARFEVVRWALGKFDVVASASRSPKDRSKAPSALLRARRDRSEVLCAGCAADEPDELSLDELRGGVLAAARAEVDRAKQGKERAR
jgi:hypothetical protein